MPSRARAALGLAAAVAAGAWLTAAGTPVPAAAPSAAERARACAACHGDDGASSSDGVPSLAAQPELFLVNQMILFREGLRRADAMDGRMEGLDDATITALAAHYARQTPRPAAPTPEEDRAMMARGRALMRAGRCDQCHLPDFAGRAQIPRLAGQREDYLARVMREYRDDVRGGADSTMNDILGEYSDGEIRALAHFLSRQPARPRRP